MSHCISWFGPETTPRSPRLRLGSEEFRSTLRAVGRDGNPRKALFEEHSLHPTVAGERLHPQAIVPIDLGRQRTPSQWSCFKQLRDGRSRIVRKRLRRTIELACRQPDAFQMYG